MDGPEYSTLKEIYKGGIGASFISIWRTQTVLIMATAQILPDRFDQTPRELFQHHVIKLTLPNGKGGGFLFHFKVCTNIRFSSAEVKAFFF